MDTNVKYIVSSRKEVSLKKPKNYVLAVLDGKTTYISSLYPTSNKDVFNAEYKGQKYTVLFLPDHVEIKERYNAK